MKFNVKPKTCISILVLTLVVGIAVAIKTYPDWSSLKDLKDQQTSVRTKISKTTAENVQNKSVIANGKVDLTGDENDLNTELTSAFTMLYGGTTDVSELSSQKSGINALLGNSKLTKELYHQVLLAKDDGTQYVLASKNNETSVNFGVLDESQMTLPITVYTNYDTGTGVQNKQILEMSYDLKNHKVLNYQVLVGKLESGDSNEQ